MNHDMTGLARARHIEFQQQIQQARLVSQAQDAQQIEQTRFRQAYQLRSLLNRFDPDLAPKLGL